MAFGLDNIADWLRNLLEEGQRTVDVVNGDAPLTNIPAVNKNVNDAIINPGKMLAEVSGVSQGYRGARPGASNMDKGLALLALTGMLSGGGAADDIARVGGQAGGRVVRGGKNKILDVFGPKAEMFHAGPTGGIKKFTPSTNAEAILGKQGKPYTYFLPKEQAIGNLPQYMAPNHRLTGTGNVTGSIYRAKVPVHRLEQYTLPGSTRPHPYGRRVSVPVKVLEEKKFKNQGVGDVNDVLRKWLNIQD